MYKILIDNITLSNESGLLCNSGTITINNYDKVGLVGLNGCGKTTLLNLIYNQVSPIKVHGSLISFNEIVSKCNFNSASGGEVVKKIIFEMITSYEFLLLDEPTLHLDKNMYQFLENQLCKYNNGYIIASHDYDLIEKCCTKLLIIEDKKLFLFDGSYKQYLEVKDKLKQTKQKEYLKYVKEAKAINNAISKQKVALDKTKKTPTRMGNSEARLHKMGDQRAQSKLGSKIDVLKAKLSKLDVVEKVEELALITLPISKEKEIHGKVLIDIKNLSYCINGNEIFNNVNVTFYNNTKVALIGANKSGKTTLFNLIINNHPKISKHQKLKIGYFDQHLNNLDYDMSIIDNILNNSIISKQEATYLLVKINIPYQKHQALPTILSQGEKVKLSLLITITLDCNLLLLDEVSNYLDDSSLKVIINLLVNTSKNIIFTSHNESFVNQITSNCLYIENKKITSKQVTTNDDKIIIDYKIAKVISELSSLPDGKSKLRLEEEYQSLLSKRKELVNK